MFAALDSWTHFGVTTFAIVLFLGIAVAILMRLRCRNPACYRVLQLTQYLGIGGLERVILNLSKGMKDGGLWSPVVFVYDSVAGAPTLHEDFRRIGVEVVGTKKGDGFSFKVVALIAREVVTKRIAVIHSHDLSALIYAVFAKWATLGAVKVVHTQHSFVHINNGPLYKHYERFFTFFADSVCAVSGGLRDQYATVRVDPNRVRLVPNGMEFPAAPVASLDELTKLRRSLVAEITDRKAAEALQARIDWTWLLCMARIHAGKGQDHILDVWHHLDERKTERVALIFLGQETLSGALDALREKASRCRGGDNVIYAGFTKRPSEWRLASHVFLSGSEFEGMPLGPIEALGAGIESFVSDIPGHSMLADHVRRFDLSDKRQGARVLEGAIEAVSMDFEQSRAEAWKKGRGVRDGFGIERMASAYEGIYRDSTRVTGVSQFGNSMN